MHIPVLKKEILEYLDPKPNENFIDCTAGEGGHLLSILEKITPNGKILAFDRDKRMVGKIFKDIEGTEREKRIILVHSNYAELLSVVKKVEIGEISGILLDLGMSSWHIGESERGFSFRRDEPLDMRYNDNEDLTAREIVNTWPKEEIEYILKNYGEERYSRRISEEIIKRRKKTPIISTFELVEAIKGAVPASYQYRRIHFATKTFQGLRIAVNEELENLKKVLPQTLEVVKKGGRVVIVSFHSLEDRIVKNFFKEKKQEKIIEILTKKPITAGEEEIKINIRSRSAKLRAALKI